MGVHPEWEARIWAVVKSAAASIENPVERALATPYLFLSQWILKLDAFEVRLLDRSIADHRGSIDRGMHSYATQSHLVCPIHIMMNKLHRRARRAYRDWQRVKKALRLLQTLPHLADFKPVAQVEKTLTMAVGAGSAGFFNTIDRAAGHANAPRRPFADVFPFGPNTPMDCRPRKRREFPRSRPNYQQA